MIPRRKPLTRTRLAARRRDTGPRRSVRDLVALRSGGGCERCGQRGAQVHHRRPRGAGGSSSAAINLPSNLLLLCAECHAWVESHRDAAYAYGWLVPMGIDPAAHPVKLHTGQFTFLTPDGQYAVHSGQESA